MTTAGGQTGAVPRRLFVVGRDEDLRGGRHVSAGEPVADVSLEQLLDRVARGDTAAFEQLYDRVAGAVYGLVLRVLRDPAQSEEVAQEVLVEVWRTAPRFDVNRGSARSWLLTMARRRAVDRVRSAQAGGERDQRAAAMTGSPAYDEVSEAVETRLEQQAVRRCLGTAGTPTVRSPSCSPSRSEPSRPGCATA
jgi:RNA polymerase sigma-70 factor (ECF subfamily)